MTTVVFRGQPIGPEAFAQRVQRSFGALRTLGVRNGDVLALIAAQRT